MGNKVLPPLEGQCQSRKSDGVGRCTQPKGFGTTHPGYGHCKFHGGLTPAGCKFAAKEAQGKGELWYGDAVDIEPHEALLEEVRRSAGHVHFLEQEIATTSGLTSVESQVLRSLYKSEREHLTKVCSLAIGAGVAERQVQVAERYGEVIATLLQNVFDQLGLTAVQRRKAPDIVRNQMRLLTAGDKQEAS